ncbi:MAG: hypothetical protein PQJ61_00220 [Spirochaetales bacterium]|uniref:Uncharacterized protein n=1 Tax=Candidatus Thalassospirochaeta sargassi TaxID=3119039 RepID=A0AAJ1MI73_9SPIO|nr:hypothetical protein [Spirochaetales bacterium]
MYRTFYSIIPQETCVSAELQLPATIPVPGEYDLLIKIEAISVNPVDFKIRQTAAENTILESLK